MIDYGITYSSVRPQQIEVTNTDVFVASNIVEVDITIDEQTIHEFEYNYVCYTKDEYLLYLAEKNEQLEEELQAAKILLGVE